MVFSCTNCGLLFRISGDLGTTRNLLFLHDYWHSRSKMCAVCEGEVMLVDAADSQDLLHAVEKGVLQCHTLTPEEAFRAFCGQGLPDEVGISVEIVESLLLSSRVTKVRVRTSPTGRVILDVMELENGLRMHFVSNAHGAGVLKITRRDDVRGPVDDVQLDLFAGTGDVSL